MVVLAEIVEWDALLKIIWVSLAAGIGVTAAFALAIAGATGMVDARRDGRTITAGAFALVLALALAVCGVAVVLGVVGVTKK
jgi:hypothetical protein